MDKTAIGHTTILSLAAVSVVAIIVYGISSCSERDSSLKSDCIRKGGSVVEYGQSFACIAVPPGAQIIKPEG